MLFAGNRLICYPAAKKGDCFTLPKDKTLGTYCFDSSKYLKKVVIPEQSAQTSCSNFFRKCKGVKVYLPKTMVQFPAVEHSGDFPLFTNCTKSKAFVHINSKAHKYFAKRTSFYERGMYSFEVR